MDEQVDAVRREVDEVDQDLHKVADDLAPADGAGPGLRRAAQRLLWVAQRANALAKQLRRILAPPSGAWARFIRFLNANGADRRTRVAIAMAVVASFGAVTAYRASEEEFKAFGCERRLGEARTYESVLRQVYLDKLSQHERWADRYALGIGYAQHLLRQGDAIRESGRRGIDPSPDLLDVEAQVELASARALIPVRDFTNPALRPGPTLERQLRTRAQADIRAIGLPSRCTPRDVVSTTMAAPDDDYLEPLRQQVEAIHAKSLQDTRSVVGFLLVLVFFTLSEVFVGRARHALEWLAAILLPAALLFASFQKDDRLPGLFAVTFLILSGLGPIIWTVIDRFELGGKRMEPLTAESLRRRYYRIARFVLAVVVVAYLTLVGWIIFAATRELSSQWPLLVFAAIIFAGLGWITWLALLLENALAALSSEPRRPLETARLPLATVLVVVALFFALPYSLATLPQRHFAGFVIYAVLLASSIGMLGFAMRTWINPLKLHEPDEVPDFKKRQRLDRTRRYVFILLVLLIASLAVPPMNWWYAPAILVAICLCTSLLGEHIWHCRGTFAVGAAPEQAHWVNKFVTSFTMMSIAVIIMAVSTLTALSEPNPWASIRLPSLLLALLLLTVFSLATEAWSRTHRDKLRPTTETSGIPRSDEPTGDVVDPATTTEIDKSLPVHGVHLRSAPGPFGAAIVTAIAATAFFSALAGFGYSAEHVSANAAADKAAEVQLSLFHGSTRESARAYHVIDDMAAYEEAHLRSVAATDLSRASKFGKLAPEARPIWDREADRWSSALNVLSGLEAGDARGRGGLALDGVPLNGRNGPYYDPSFPEALFAHATTEVTARELALWDAYDEHGTDTEERATKLLGAIALFSIALYLFGQALQMGRRGRAGYLLASFGLIMTGCGFFIAITVVPPLRSIDAIVALPDECSTAEDRVMTTRADAAALCFAHAELLTRLARGQNDFKGAHDAYVAATTDALRPEFALALYRAVLITSQAATPQTHTSYVSIVRRDKLESLLEEDRRVARDLQLRDRIVPASLVDSDGFHRYLHAQISGNERELGSAMTTYERIDMRNAGDPAFLFHQGLVELAGGHEDRSGAAYDSALRHGEPNPELSLAAISDLELLRSACTFGWKDRCLALQRSTTAAEASIVARTWLPGPSTPTFTALRPSATTVQPRLAASVSPGGIAWRLTALRAADVAAGPPVLIVHRYDSEWKSWYAVPDVSGAVTSGEITADPKGAAVVGFRSVLAGPTNGGCLDATGSYRVAIYFGNRLVAEKDVALPISAPAFDGVSIREEGVALCYPAGSNGWRREAPSNNTLSEGYTAADGRRGLRVFGFFSKRFPTTRERSMNEDDMMRRAIDITSYRLRGHSIAPKRYDQATSKCGYAGIPAGTTRAFTFAHLSMMARAWTNADGLVFVGVVWHDREQTARPEAPDTLSCSTLGSMIPIDLLPSPS